MILDIKSFDTTTHDGWRKAIEFENKNPDYKLLTSRLEFTWYYEKQLENE
jgi:hypothetical protein|tara:strand:- start:134 stop:283 length:150 start_codon:yes stop_codon:yes gene_type:complete